MSKSSKKLAGYVESQPCYYCGSCRFFIPSGACQIVLGVIKYNGCCNLWQHNKNKTTCKNIEIKKLLRC